MSSHLVNYVVSNSNLFLNSTTARNTNSLSLGFIVFLVVIIRVWVLFFKERGLHCESLNLVFCSFC